MQSYDVVIIGAGAAGMMCAVETARRGRSVLILDHAAMPGEKIRISGGGRCNFTNIHASPRNFLSGNPHFCISALSRYTKRDFIALVERHGIAYHEKTLGQLFCDGSARQIINMLVSEMQDRGAELAVSTEVRDVSRTAEGFTLSLSSGTVACQSLVVACGGKSIPKMGATGFGYELATQFGLAVVETRPALVPLTFDAEAWAPFAALSGLSLPVRIAAGSGAGRGEFLEDLLFTHRGLSGPAVLQASSYWRPGTPIEVDLAPELDLGAVLREAKAISKRQLGNELAAHLPARLAETWLAGRDELARRPLPELRDRDLAALAESLQRWWLLPTGSEGWRKAEVTAGGVDTRELSSQSFESRRVPGLHFIGEVVDVTGWLGGYNFQWAWASAHACATACAELARPAASASAA